MTRARFRRVLRRSAHVAFLAPLLSRSTGRGVRRLSAVALVLTWIGRYWRYRRDALERTAAEHELLRTASWDVYVRHYNEQVPTIEEEFDVWGDYHRHRHGMRYDLVAAQVDASAPDGGAVLDIGCGSALVADRLLDRDLDYVGVDLPRRHLEYAATRFDGHSAALRIHLVRSAGERLPFRDGQFDVVVMSEVIEHLLCPEIAVWEVARVLRPGGRFVMTTNNASEAPCESPTSNPIAWVEKMVAADRPGLMSRRPWVWPHPMDDALLVPGSGPVYLPHTHHIQAETRALFAAAGLTTVQWSTFEFPPPQSRTARALDAMGGAGRAATDLIERSCQALPGVRRLGCHLFMVAEKTGGPVADEPPPGVWPGPFSDGSAVPVPLRSGG